MVLTDIEHVLAKRRTVGLDAIDWVYGSTIHSDGRQNWGLPVGAVSLWAGAAGCGKSRLAVFVAARFSLEGHNILFAQNEVSLSQFRGWVEGHNHDARRIHVLDSPELNDMLEAMRQVQPSLVIIDSVSMLEGVGRQAGAKQIIQSLKRTAEQTGCHVVLIGHLNSRGKIKGGSTIPHLVDTVAQLERGDIDSWVRFGIYDKHRFGPTGRSVMLIHETNGLRVVFASDSEHPMMSVRIDPITNAIVRRIPIPGAGSGGKEIDIGGDGKPLQKSHRWLRRRVLAG